MPLPNLDFKIMQGNSLLESYKGVDLDVTSKKLKTGKDIKKTRGVLSLGFEETDVQKVIQDLVNHILVSPIIPCVLSVASRYISM